MNDNDNSETEIGIFHLIREKRNNLSKSQKKIADYIVNNYEKAAFMTAFNLGKEVGISESTVVRFATVIGFSGYPEFQEKLAGMVQEKIHSIEKIEIAAGSMSQDMVLDNVMRSDSEKIKLTLDYLDREAFEIAIESILKAETIYVVGVRSCAPLASFFCFYLRQIFTHVVEISSSNTSEVFEQMMRISANDVVIGISFPRYSMRTLKAMEFANNRSAHVIAITDSKHSPINMYSSCNLFAISDMASIVDSLAAPLSLINAFIVALCLRQSDTVIHNLEILENIWYDYNFESNDEINLFDENVVSKLKRYDKNITK